ncbi:uncharacterized protein Triagg1_8384 [Trichoderma aggressivum f. europaeum]|uniref:Uncharacterized protein n=1 Tax=Trichoderma aggressivum f. europaeum TaxID=173218 RepID=A0AAE1I845_9HYPO|nr:hypothetical protein Triagg1_8384 [Trichoderma aggressivum f. europaeum]
MPPTPVQSITTPSSDETPNFSAQQTYLNQTSELDINGLVETSPCTSDDFNGPEEPEWQRRLSSLPLGDITKFEIPFHNLQCLNCSTPCYQRFNDVLDGIRKAVDLLHEAMAIPAQIMKNSQETIPPASSLPNNKLDGSQRVTVQDLDCNDLSDNTFISQLLQSGEDWVSSRSAGSPSVYIGNEDLDMLVDTQGLEEITDPT